MNLNMKPFNGLYFACWGIAVLIIVAIALIFKNKSERAKKIFIISFCGFLLGFFFLYKYWLSVDKNYFALCNPPMEKFNWFSELPFHLCNINMFLIPIGVLTKKRGILGFSFFLAPLGAAMALIFPELPFDGYPITLPRVIGFYGTHFLIVIIGITLATLGFFRPKFKDFPGIFITFICLAICIHFINLLFIKTGICTNANYFYTMNDAGISILKLFHNLIPKPFFYLLPALLILGTYMTVVTFGFLIAQKIKTANGKTEEKKEPARV